MEKGLYTILHAVVAMPLGLAGFIGSLLWYRSLNSRGSYIAGMQIGPVLLGIFCLLLTIWAALAIAAFWRAREDIENDV